MVKEKKVNEKWEKTRLMGKTRFIWRYGVLQFGLWMFIIMGVIYPLVTHQTMSLQRFLISLVIYSIGGWLWGFSMWYVLEKQR